MDTVATLPGFLEVIPIDEPMIPEETGRFLRRIAMDGPGEYLPDVTEGITRVEDLQAFRREKDAHQHLQALILPVERRL